MGYASHLCIYGVYLVLGSWNSVVFVYDERISVCGRLWPDYVQKRIKDTYIYFGGSLALTAVTATAAFRSPALMRFMTKSSFLVSIVINSCYYAFLAWCVWNEHMCVCLSKFLLHTLIWLFPYTFLFFRVCLLLIGKIFM